MALRRRELLLLAAVAVFAAAAGFVAGPFLRDRGSEGGEALAHTTFLDLTGRPRQMTEWRGRVVVVNFWATWCAPCREEIPMFQAAREQYVANGVEIVGIAVDSAAKVSEFVSELKIRYPILVSDAEAISLMRELGNSVGGLPYTVFLAPNGQVADRKLGPLNRADLDRRLSGLIRTGSS